MYCTVPYLERPEDGGDERGLRFSSEQLLRLRRVRPENLLVSRNETTTQGEQARGNNNGIGRGMQGEKRERKKRGHVSESDQGRRRGEAGARGKTNQNVPQH